MLTPTQRATLKTNIQSIPAVNTLYVDGNLGGLADYYNQIAVPDFWVWRALVAKSEFLQSVSVDGTTFNWTGAGYITRSTGERDAWRELFDGEGFCNPSLVSVRQAVTDIFSGATAPAPANRTHLLTVARRKATNVEKLFATGTGSTTVPATMTVDGTLSYTEFIGL